MKLAYLCSSRIPSREANSIQVMKMCEAFVEIGHQVELIARPGEGETTDPHAHYGVAPEFEIIRIPAPPGRRLRDVWLPMASLWALKRRPLPHVLYSRDSTFLAAAAHTGLPMVYEAHEPPHSGINRAIKRWLFGRRNFERLVVISRALGEEYLARFPSLPPDRLLVAHDGATPVEPQEGADPRSLEKGRLRAGYVGHLYRGKGVGLLLRLAARLPKMDFEIVGGTEEDLRRWRGRAGGLTNVHFHGFVPHGQLERQYRMFQIALLPYQRDVRGAGGERNLSEWMSPLKLFEYMARGKAIVASDLPVLREVLTDGVTAILCDPEDEDAWVEALTWLREDDALRSRLGRAAREEVERRYGWTVRAERVLSGVA